MITEWAGSAASEPRRVAAIVAVVIGAVAGYVFLLTRLRGDRSRTDRSRTDRRRRLAVAVAKLLVLTAFTAFIVVATLVSW